jgi:hypothetical protein
MFIIWDRMFGTYKVEAVRKDYYGLAKQPQTFGAEELNTNHLKTMSRIGNRSWLGRLVARRVPANWVFNPMALFEPIPPPDPEADQREKGPVRKKWDGHAPSSPLARVYIGVISGATLGALVQLLLTKGNLTPAASMATALTLSTQLASIGRLVDHNPKNVSSTMMFSGALVPLLFGILTYGVKAST